MTLVDALARIALLAFPAAFRRVHGADLLRAFRDAAERRTAGAAGRGMRARLAVGALLVRELGGMVWAGLQVRRGGRGGRMGHLDGRTTMGGWEGARHDFTQALNTVRRAPGFALAAALILALGIGANTALLSVARGVVWLPLPYPEAERLVVVSTSFPGNDRGGDMGSVLDYAAVTERGHGFESLALFHDEGLTLGAPAEPTRVIVNFVEADYFPLIGGRAALGRLFDAGEARLADADRVVVLGHGLWTRTFGADAEVVGRTVVLDGVSFEVVGVMAPDVHDLEVPSRPAVEAWVPLAHVPALLGVGQADVRGARIYQALARLRPGVTSESTRAEVLALGDELARRFPDDNEGFGLWVLSARDYFFATLYQPVAMLLAGAVLVLLLGCANIAHLLFARLGDRRGELAVRTALGATRPRLARQLLFEAGILCGVGAAGGLLLGLLGARALAGWDALTLPPLISVRVDGVVFGAVVALTVGAALLVGALPALRGSDTGSVAGGVRGVAGRSRLPQRALIVAEIAIAVVLSVGAGLTAASLRGLMTTELGYVPERLLTFRLDLPRDRYAGVPEREAFRARFVQRLNADPGVEAVFTTGPAALGVGGWVSFLHPDGPAPTPGDYLMVQRHSMDVGAFDVLGVPIVEGRAFDERDTEAGDRVAIVSQDLASRFWPEGGAVGRTIRTNRGQELTVVGVTRTALLGQRFDIRYGAWALDPQYDLFQPTAQVAGTALVFGVRTRGAPEDAVPAARRALSGVDPALALYQVTSMERRLAEQEGPSRAVALLLGVYAVVALLLAAVGVYGVVAHQVARSLPEAGVRLALGASPSSMIRAVVGGALIPAALGGVLGVGLSMLGGRLFASVLFGVSPADPVLLGGSVSLLLVVALLASLGPARRLARLDPRTILTSE